jgi:hypothetical protein
VTVARDSSSEDRGRFWARQLEKDETILSELSQFKITLNFVMISPPLGEITPRIWTFDPPINWGEDTARKGLWAFEGRLTYLEATMQGRVSRSNTASVWNTLNGANCGSAKPLSWELVRFFLGSPCGIKLFQWHFRFLLQSLAGTGQWLIWFRLNRRSSSVLLPIRFHSKVSERSRGSVFLWLKQPEIRSGGDYYSLTR